jgi:hypothetical protein
VGIFRRAKRQLAKIGRAKGHKEGRGSINEPLVYE